MSSVTASETMKLGYAEYARIPDDGRRHEIIDPIARAVQQLVLREGRFQLEPAVDVLRPTIAPDVTIPLHEIW